MNKSISVTLQILGLLGRFALCAAIAAFASQILGSMVPSHKVGYELWVFLTFFGWGILSTKTSSSIFSMLTIILWVCQLLWVPFDFFFFYLSSAAFLGRYFCQKAEGLSVIPLIAITAVIMATAEKEACYDGCATGQNSAISKEAASMISSAYSTYLLSHKPSGDASAADIIPFMNFVKIDTGSDFVGGSLGLKANYWEELRDSIRKSRADTI